MSVTLDWLGVATFRLTVDDLVIFLDAYMDRVPAAPPVGLTTKEVERADFILVGHSHFDHLWGAERIARNTGAMIIGSHETVRLMVNEEVPEAQLWRQNRERPAPVPETVIERLLSRWEVPDCTEAHRVEHIFQP